MKKITSIGILLLLTVFATLITGCRKYPESPMISTMSPTTRVVNTWKIDNYKINGIDLTSLLSGYTETFTKDGNYSYQWGMADGKGTWEFQNNSKEIRITGTEDQENVTLYILKLEDKVLWYYYMDGNDKKELHLVQN